MKKYILITLFIILNLNCAESYFRSPLTPKKGVLSPSQLEIKTLSEDNSRKRKDLELKEDFEEIDISKLKKHKILPIKEKLSLNLLLNQNLPKRVREIILNYLFSYELLQTFPIPIVHIYKLLDGKLAVATGDNSIMTIDSKDKTLSYLDTESIVESFTQLNNGRLACSIKDENDKRIIKIYDLNDPDNGKILEDHHNSKIRSIIQLEHNLIASGSIDNTIKIWNLESLQCEDTFDAHKKQITFLCKLTGGKFASSSEDNTVKIWDYKNLELIKNIDLSCIPTSLCQLHDGRLLIGLRNGILEIWDSQFLRCLVRFQAHSNTIYDICQLKNSSIATSSLDKTIKIWNYTPFETPFPLKYELDGDDGIVKICESDDGKLISGSLHGNLEIWESPFDS